MSISLFSSGRLRFRAAPKTMSAEFLKKYRFTANSEDIPYVYIPVVKSVSNEIIGKIGMITDITNNIHSYFIVGGVTSNTEYFLVSENLMRTLNPINNVWDISTTNDYSVLLSSNDINWENSQSLYDQMISVGNDTFGYYEISTSSSIDSVINPNSINLNKIYPYVISIDRYTDDVNYTSLISYGVVGVIIEVGYLYDNRHLKLDRYANPLLVSQIRALGNYNLPFGFYAVTRAKTVSESDEELDRLIPLLQRYSPVLGIWIQPDFPVNQIKSINDRILDNYKKRLTSDRVGFSNAIGIYANESQLHSITWDTHCKDWYLWYDRQVGNIAEAQKLLTPEMFMVE